MPKTTPTNIEKPKDKATDHKVTVVVKKILMKKQKIKKKHKD
jgi:hypothetical protein